MYSLGGYIVKEYAGSRQKVEAEIAILRQLSHDGLISYEFIADEGPRISIVMAWAGVPLREHRLEHAAEYGEDAARHMAHQLASALAFLHSRGIVHRDVKPDNLGVQPDQRLQLFDWGEAVALAEAAALSDRELSRRVGVAGTPLFMPPESLNHITRRASDGGDGSGDEQQQQLDELGGGGACANDGSGVPGLRATLAPALDVWGLGTVVYFLLAGRDIFVPESEWELEELADVVNCSSGVGLPEGTVASHGARDFLARCLERCPARRASAAELLRHPWLRGASTRAEVEAARAADAAAAAAQQRRLSRVNSASSLSGMRRAGSAARLHRAGSSGSLARVGSSGSLTLPSGAAPRPMRRTASGRLLAAPGSSASDAAAKLAAAAGASSPPRPPLVEGAAVCEVTLKKLPGAAAAAAGSAAAAAGATPSGAAATSAAARSSTPPTHPL